MNTDQIKASETPAPTVESSDATSYEGLHEGVKALRNDQTTPTVPPVLSDESKVIAYLTQKCLELGAMLAKAQKQMYDLAKIKDVPFGPHNPSNTEARAASLDGWKVFAVKRYDMDHGDGCGEVQMLEVHGESARGLGFEISIDTGVYTDEGVNPIVECLVKCLRDVAIDWRTLPKYANAAGTSTIGKDGS